VCKRRRLTDASRRRATARWCFPQWDSNRMRIRSLLPRILIVSSMYCTLSALTNATLALPVHGQGVQNGQETSPSNAAPQLTTRSAFGEMIVPPNLRLGTFAIDLGLVNDDDGLSVQLNYVMTSVLARTLSRKMTIGHLEQYPLSAISALAERGGCSTHAKVSPRSRTVLMPGGRPRGPFARHHTDSTRERTQAGEAAIRSS